LFPFRWKVWLKSGLKLSVALLIAWMVGRHVLKVWAELRASGAELVLDWRWLVASIGLYIGGLAAFGRFYHAILYASLNPTPLTQSMRAYAISHLGKYVPGKALVVVVRAGLSSRAGARPATAALATFYETLGMMAVGALLSSIVFLINRDEAPPVGLPLGRFGRLNVPLWLLSAGLAAPLVTVVLPVVFPRIAMILRAPFPGVGRDALPPISWRLLGSGLCWSLLGWTLWGLSQVAVVRGIGLSTEGVAALPPTEWPRVIASVALATVAGFAVAVFPGGLVVREGVLMAALGSTLGSDEAVVAALALRMAWILAELVAAGLVAPFRPRPSEVSMPTPVPAVDGGANGR
jgi:glycosyltransferase 2 family protein